MIYPIDEAALVTDDFVIPTHWPKAYGLDVGWNKTACVWGAWDRQSDTVYIWSEYYQGQMPPSVHASAIRARGDWISGAIDPASAGSSQKDGSRLIDEYRNEGLSIYEADNAVEAGLFAVYQRMARGGLKIFKSCRNVLSELRIYRRDEKGKVVKENDHLMDALRYLTMTGMIYASVAPQQREEWSRPMVDLGRNAETGY
ncbi:MAG: hypothetical protein KGL35_20395 [Bradyrhizobium sp.]|nr:hypothetical protein [Bradyrhizobium sp.]